MSKEFNIRALNISDWTSFRDVRLEALRFYPQCFGASYSDELRYSQKDWTDKLERKGDRVFGLFDNKVLIGINGVNTFRGDSDGKSALMTMWYMRTGYQGRGLFGDLVKAGIDWAEAEKRFDRICVNRRESNKAPLRSIEKYGFTSIAREPWTWPDGKTENLCMYERRFER